MGYAIKLLDLQHRRSPFPFLGDLLKSKSLGDLGIQQRQGGVPAQALVMADVKDILGVVRGGDGTPSRPAPKKEKMKRPEGMSREAFALLGDSHPIAPVVELSKKAELKGLKEKRKISSPKGTVLWKWMTFNPPGRPDLKLEHWTKVLKDAVTGRLKVDEEEYPFKKFNKKLTVLKYNDEEWEDVLVRDADWSREETDYLLDLCQRLDLRFMAIADRYEYPGGKPRSLEDLKARYYAVARQLLVGREGAEDCVANHVLIKHPFNPVHERDRKRALEFMMQRTAQQDAEENAILEQARKIEADRRAEDAARQQEEAARAGPPAQPAAIAQALPASLTEPAAPMEISEEPEEGQSSLWSAEVKPEWPDKPGMVARRAHCDAMAAKQLEALPAGSRVPKLVDSTMAELGVSGPPEIATRATCGAYLALRAEVIALQELKRRLANKAGLDDGARSKGKSKARYDDGIDDDTPAPVAKRPRITKRFLDD